MGEYDDMYRPSIDERLRRGEAAEDRLAVLTADLAQARNELRTCKAALARVAAVLDEWKRDRENTVDYDARAYLGMHGADIRKALSPLDTREMEREP